LGSPTRTVLPAKSLLAGFAAPGLAGPEGRFGRRVLAKLLLTKQRNMSQG
jgi:hypothetical protein